MAALSLVCVAWLALSCAGTMPPPGVELEKEIVFGKIGERELTLNLTHPKQQPQGDMPAVVFIHGGGGIGGNKESYHSFMFHLSQHGVVCITMGYRLAPRDRFPAQLEDVKCAVRWLRDHAEKYRVDPARIMAFGDSAGAYLAALLGVTAGQPQWEGQGGYAEQSSAVCAVVGISGIYDLPLGYQNSVHLRPQEGEAVRNMLEAVLGGSPQQMPERYRDASPINHVSRSSPPMLLVHGSADELIAIEQSERFAEKLKEAGVHAELLRIEGGAHCSFGKDSEHVLREMEAYVKKSLGLEELK